MLAFSTSMCELTFALSAPLRPGPLSPAVAEVIVSSPTTSSVPSLHPQSSPFIAAQWRSCGELVTAAVMPSYRNTCQSLCLPPKLQAYNQVECLPFQLCLYSIKQNNTLSLLIRSVQYHGQRLARRPSRLCCQPDGSAIYFLPCKPSMPETPSTRPPSRATRGPS